MSVYSSDYSLSSVNSHNENIYNTQKLEKSSKYRLRRIFKKILKKFIKNTSKKSSKQLCKCRNTTTTNNSYDFESEICDNSANETLETRILDEIRDCGDNSAVFVYGENEFLVPVNKSQPYVPVHFARTEAGTFFWTSLKNNNNSCTAEQLPELRQTQYDRWVQA